MTNQIRLQFLVRILSRAHSGGVKGSRRIAAQKDRTAKQKTLHSPSPRLFGDNPDRTPAALTQTQISSASHRAAIVQESATKQAKINIIFHLDEDVTSGKFAIL